MAEIFIQCYFNNTELSSVPGLTVTETNPYGMPEYETNGFPLASTDGAALASQYYRKRIINIQCTLTRTSRALLEQSIDTLKSILRPQEKTLQLMIAGSIRLFTATAQNTMITDNAGGFAKINIEFLCSDPFGYDPYLTTALAQTGITATSQSYNFSVTGTAKQQPIFSITVNSVTGGTNKEISLTLASISAAISVTRTWAAGDVLVIDTHAKTVKVNGTAVDYDGPLPDLEVGTYSALYADEFTTRNVSLTVQYTKRYL